MQAIIRITHTKTGEVVASSPVTNEKEAQDTFDEMTSGSSEFDSSFQWDLIAHHPEEGELIRRTVYSKFI